MSVYKVNVVLLYLFFGWMVTDAVISPVNQFQPSDNLSFEQTLDQLDKAIGKFILGDAALFKKLWHQSEDVSISGGMGGPVEKGWANLEQRLVRVAEQFPPNGEFTTQRIAWQAGDEFGYLVQYENFLFTGTNSAENLSRDYRVTMVFKQTSDGWRLVHRHADTHLDWTPPR